MALPRKSSLAWWRRISRNFAAKTESNDREAAAALMLFVEFRFFWFFLAVFCVYWSLRENRSRKIWLLVCSYFFYAAWDWRFLFLLFGSSALDYFVGLRLARSEDPGARRRWLILSLCVNLGTIAIFKYCNFFIASGAVFLSWLGLPANPHTLNIII